MLQHKYITVNTDQMKEYKKATGWVGDLVDYAAHMFNKWMAEMVPEARIINVEKTFWTDNIHPVECNSATWYDCKSVKLSVWLETDKIIPRDIYLTKKGEKKMSSCGYKKGDSLYMVSNFDENGRADISCNPSGVITTKLSKEDFVIG